MAITEGTDICIYNGASSVMLRSVDCNPFSHLTLTLKRQKCALLISFCTLEIWEINSPPKTVFASRLLFPFSHYWKHICSTQFKVKHVLLTLNVILHLLCEDSDLSNKLKSHSPTCFPVLLQIIKMNEGHICFH